MSHQPARSRSVLLAHSYYLRYDEKQWRRMKPYPPLATLAAAALLRDRGYDVQLFDAMLADGVEEFFGKLEDVQPAIVGILEDNFNFLTKMCTVRMREAALDMIRAAKAAGCRVAVNGFDASDRPELYLDAGADAVILREPEFAMAELVSLWTVDPTVSLDRVRGLALPANSQSGEDHRSRRTVPSDFIGQLGALPFPAWDLVDVERYRVAWTNAHGRLSWNMVTSRGCPYRCNWCAKPVFGSRYTQRRPNDVAEELERLRDAVAPDHIWFADDIFGLTKKWIHDFASAVEERRIRTPFTMQSRVNLMKPQVVADLAESGAEEVWLGVESGSQRILDAMDKGTTIAQIREGTRTLKAHGVRACWFIQLGYLGEDWDDIVLTRNLIREERPDEIGVSVSYPLPGTKFYDVVSAELGTKRNWIDSDDLAMLFHGTYVTPFYKKIRDLLHDEVEHGGTAESDTQSAALEARWQDLERLELQSRSDATTPARR